MVHWVTQRVVTRFDFIHVYQRVVGKGRGGDGWNVEVFTFQARARVRLKRQGILLQIIIPLLLCHREQSHTTVRILLQAALWIWQRHFKHADYPALISL